ncbi:MAG: alpha/beta hydrolase [Solirubrobacteraceae bacterium]|nr:alpha/beta hydrolase [Solirubrobacteraceae bacterium]
MDPARLFTTEVGGGPPVVLLHGLTATHRYVVMGSTALERAGHRVIAYDARGHGASAPAPAPDAYRYEDLAADLLAVLDARGVERAVLAGASMGAHTALRVALEHPERVAGLVVITPAYDPAQHLDAASLARWDALSDGLRDGGVEGFVTAYGEPAGDPAWHDTLRTVLRQRLGAHEHPEAVADALRAVPRSRPFGEISDLGAIGVPVVVVADRDEPDPGHPLAVGQAYAAAIPGARLVVEEPGASPVAWQGGRLSRIIAELAAQAS